MKEIVVISGKGGTGKTSIASSLAAVMPSKVLADCDVDAADLHLILRPEVRETTDFISGEIAIQNPDACTQCGLCLEHCRFGAVSEGFGILPEHCEGCGLCAFVCPSEAIRMQSRHCGWWYVSDTRNGSMVHAKLKAGEENSGKLVTTVRRASHDLAEAEGRDYVLVDGSPGIGCPVIASLTNTDMVLLVAEPTVSAVHDLKRVHELTTHFRIPAAAVINKADINEAVSAEIEEFCKQAGIPVLGRFGYDPVFTKAQLAELSAAEFDPEHMRPQFEAVWKKMESLLAD